MVTEVNMSRKLFLILCLASGVANADCYSRTAMSNQTTAKITAVADVKRKVVPVGHQQNKCIVSFRAQIDDGWVTAEGENVGANTESLDQLCASAMSAGKSEALTRIAGSTVNVEQDMVCTDEPNIQIRKVQVGEHIKESELTPHPNFTKQFKYRGTVCRWFIEPEGRVGDMIPKQGVACRIQDNDWQVVDKW